MALRKVYRIEDEAGHGPFKGGHVSKARDDAYGEKGWRHDPYEMPTPHKDSEGDVARLLRESSGASGMGYHWMVFGFPTKAAMRRWFKPALLRRLGQRGYRLSVYRVRDTEDTYAASANQTLFDRRAACLDRVERFT